MKKILRFTQYLAILVGALGTTIAYAALAAHLPRGEKTIEIAVPGKNPEVCVVPKHLAGALSSSDDSAAEARLCAIDENVNAAVCPKTNSTNPGLDLNSLPQGFTSAQVAAANCKTQGSKKIAKYKLSTSCSYTPSILGYYHLSRMLGGIGNVPPAVIRTFDLQKHIALGRKALAATPSSSLIHQTWASLMAQLTAGSSASRRDLLLTDDFKQSYGALSVNPKKEAFYKEFFNGGANNVAKATNFRDKNPITALLARNGDINTLVGRSFSASNVQTMVQLQDAADMIVIDTLMNQQDRFGNIHYLEVYYYQDPKDVNADGSKRIKLSHERPADPTLASGAVQVKKMLLKDNDCGVAKQNVAKQANLADRIAHISPDTYKRLLKLDAIADGPDTKDFFTKELLFTAADYTNVRKNLHDLAAKLHQACSQGHLRPDLDLDEHFSDRSTKAPGCDL